MSYIASELIAVGISFSIHVLDSTVSARPVKFHISALDYLPFNCTLSAMDYTAYLDQRDSSLHCPYSRARLMNGGIIEQLAWEALGEYADMVA